MSKYQKALIIVKEQLRSYYDILDLEFPLKVLDSIKLLQKSVDKQKPQKVKRISVLTYEVVECPICQKEFVTKFHKDDYDYCPSCGQKLDWEVGNDTENDTENDIDKFNKM